ncbi:MAG: hypothetical protein KGH53_01775 [Candidatus Micrarchaeota archaeon]|nr:hypothetical protein [Candidatus Micrarchaeota archaeon]
MEVFEKNRKDKSDREAASEPAIFSREFRLSSNSFDDATLRFGKLGVLFKGNYLGTHFKMEANINGTIKFELGRDSSYPAIFVEKEAMGKVLYGTELQASQIRQVAIDLWRSYNDGVHDRMLNRVAEPYRNWGHIQNFLDRTADFERGLEFARIEAMEPKKSARERILGALKRYGDSFPAPPD